MSHTNTSKQRVKTHYALELVKQSIKDAYDTEPVHDF